MQSLLQYRRFGQYVEAQYDKDIARARWRAQNPPRKNKTLPATPQGSVVTLPHVTPHGAVPQTEKKVSDTTTLTDQPGPQHQDGKPELRRMKTEEIFVFRGEDVSIHTKAESAEKSAPGAENHEEDHPSGGEKDEGGRRAGALTDVEKDVTRAIRRGYGWSHSGKSSVSGRQQVRVSDTSVQLPIQTNSPPPVYSSPPPGSRAYREQRRQQQENYSTPPRPPKAPHPPRGPKRMRPVSNFHKHVPTSSGPLSPPSEHPKREEEAEAAEAEDLNGLFPPPLRPSPSRQQQEQRQQRQPAPNTRPTSLGTALGATLPGISISGVREIRHSRAPTSTHQIRSFSLPFRSSSHPLRTSSHPRRTPSHPSPSSKVFIVGYDGPNDIMNPHNWPLTTRLGATANIALIAFIVGFASSVDSAALVPAAKEFAVSEIVESLATGTFLVGFGVGALWSGPLSEAVGRNPVYLVGLSVYVLFVLGSALARNVQEQLVLRFLAGCFAATPLTCAGGSMSDLWGSVERTWAFPVFALAAFLGPVLGPVVGGFVVQSGTLGWRWVEWVTLIASWAVLGLLALFQPETYAPVLLGWKARRLRALTGDERFKAEIEVREESLWTRLVQSLYRPLVFTVREPIIVLIGLYLTVIYVILFTFLNGYTYIFKETYDFDERITGLSFLGIGIGLCLAICLVPFMCDWARQDLARCPPSKHDQLRPEFRLWFAMLGAPAIPISLLWMGWTDYPHIPYWSPLAASVLFGYGILCVFISSYQYIIDGYEAHSASALTSVTLVRYVAAGGSTAYAIPMYERLGTHWTLTVLAGISAVMVPVPYVFYWYGPQIRKRSKYTVM